MRVKFNIEKLIIFIQMAFFIFVGAFTVITIFSQVTGIKVLPESSAEETESKNPQQEEFEKMIKLEAWEDFDYLAKKYNLKSNDVCNLVLDYSLLSHTYTNSTALRASFAGCLREESDPVKEMLGVPETLQKLSSKYNIPPLSVSEIVLEFINRRPQNLADSD